MNAEQKIDEYRQQANIFATVRPVIESYNGKVYNKRFSEALKQAVSESGYIYSEKGANGRRFWIHYSPKGHGYNYRTICNMAIDDALTNGKKINAAAILDSMRDTRAELLKKAAELEEVGRHAEEIKAQIEMLENTISAVLAPLSYEARELYEIKVRRYY